jgi:hypothetical protein
MLPDTRNWAELGRRDLFKHNLPLAPGFPICSVKVTGKDKDACYTELKAQAEIVRNEVSWM